jgi:hypothetical protein
MDVFSLNLQSATNGPIGPQAGGATLLQRYLLPYMEQDNLYKTFIITNNNDPDSMLTDVSDGTSNTMMFATRAGGEVISDLLVHQPAGPQGIIAILIGLRADPSVAGGHKAAERAAPLDIWEHAYGLQNVPATKGILIGLLVPEGVAAPTDSSTPAPVVDPSNPNVVYLVGSNRFMTTNTTLADEAIVATTHGRGARASQITHDVEFEKWAGASQYDRAQASSIFYDLLASSYRERADARTQSDSAGRPFVDVNSILHEDNEFHFPRV